MSLFATSSAAKSKLIGSSSGSAIEALASFYLFLKRKIADGPKQILSFGFRMTPSIDVKAIPLILQCSIAFGSRGLSLMVPSASVIKLQCSGKIPVPPN